MSFNVNPNFPDRLLEHLQATLDLKLKIAFHAILRHELFHFEADCMAAN